MSKQKQMKQSHIFSPKILGLGALAGAAVLAGSLMAPMNVKSLHAEAVAEPALVKPFYNAPESFADLVDKIKPSVVSIQVQGKRKTRVARRGFNRRDRGPGAIPGIPKDHPLYEFFKKFGEQRGFPGQQSPRARPTQSQGSGFFISPDGYVVTNHHVVNGGEKFTVKLDDGTKLTAKLIGSDQRTDLALLKIDEKRTFPFVPFTKNDTRVGDWVLAVGNPFGLGGTVTAGIVSARGRDIGSSPYDFLQIDAAVNRGNSGGPAFNLKGEVVGVNTAIYSPSGGNVGIAFAIPSELVQQVVADLKASGKVKRGWLGVTIQNVTKDIGDSMGMEKAYGAMITGKTKGGPAIGSQLQVGDVILQVNGQKIEDSRDLARKIAAVGPGETANLKVLRHGAEKSFGVKLGQFPTGKQLANLEKNSSESQSTTLGELGLDVRPNENNEGAQEGVLVFDVDPDSDAAVKGLAKGDVIVEIAGNKVNTVAAAEGAVKKAKTMGRRAVLLRVKKGQNQLYVALPLIKPKKK